MVTSSVMVDVATNTYFYNIIFYLFFDFENTLLVCIYDWDRFVNESFMVMIDFVNDLFVIVTDFVIAILEK